MIEDFDKPLSSVDELIGSARFAQTVLNASLNGLYIYDVKLGRHVFINKRCTSLTGYTIETLKTINEAQFLELFHPNDRQRMVEHKEKLVTGSHDMLEIEYRFKTKDGRWIWCLSRDAVFAGTEDDSVSHIIGTFLDITDRKQVDEHLGKSEQQYRSLSQNHRAVMLHSIVDDVTERKDAELALRDSEARMKSIVLAAPIGIGVVSNRVIQDVNDRFCELSGYSRDELIGKNARVVYPTDEEYEYVGREKYRQIERSGTGTVETRLQRKDGRIIDVLISSTPIDLTDLSSGITFTVLDISERKRAEESVKKSEESLRLAVEGGGLGTWNHDLITDEVAWNQRLYEFLGRDPNGPAISGETFFKYIHNEDLARVRAHVEEAFKEGAEFIEEFRVIREDGKVCWLAAHGQVYRDSAGRLVRMAGVNYDITERKRAEQVLKQYRQELEQEVACRTNEIETQYKELEELNEIIRQLAGKTIEAMETERRSLSKEIHDGIAGTLAAIKMNLEAWLVSSGQGVSADRMPLERIVEHLAQAIQETRTISRQLRSAILDDFGLKPALVEHIQQFNEFYPGIEIVSQIEIATDDIPTDVQTVLYRVVQEALNNVGKHSAATVVRVKLTRNPNQICLEVADNGRGFDRQKVLSEARSLMGYGIHSIRERVEICGGEFQIRSEPGKGTVIDIFIPIVR